MELKISSYVLSIKNSPSKDDEPTRGFLGTHLGTESEKVVFVFGGGNEECGGCGGGKEVKRCLENRWRIRKFSVSSPDHLYAEYFREK